MSAVSAMSAATTTPLASAASACAVALIGASGCALGVGSTGCATPSADAAEVTCAVAGCGLADDLFDLSPVTATT
jgi:hypothetical protein